MPVRSLREFSIEVRDSIASASTSMVGAARLMLVTLFGPSIRLCKALGDRACGHDHILSLKEAAPPPPRARSRQNGFDEIVDPRKLSGPWRRWTVERTLPGTGTSVPRSQCNHSNGTGKHDKPNRFRLGHRLFREQAIACLIRYWITTIALSFPRRRRYIDYLGGMWATCRDVSFSFFREPSAREASRLEAQRFMATCVSSRCVRSTTRWIFRVRMPDGCPALHRYAGYDEIGPARRDYHDGHHQCLPS